MFIEWGKKWKSLSDTEKKTYRDFAKSQPKPVATLYKRKKFCYNELCKTFHGSEDLCLGRRQKKVEQ